MGGHRLAGRSWLFVIAVLATLSLVAPVFPATSVAQPPDMLAAAAGAEPAVVRIDTRIDYQRAIGVGSGIVLSPQGEVLTNFHVVQGADNIIGTIDGVGYAADLIGYNRRRDIAVLQLHGAGGLPVARIGDSTRLAAGAPVVALGNANGTQAPLTREVGTVIQFGRTVTAEDTLTGSSEELSGLFEIAAPVRAGDSGGPVVNGAGEVVGITTAASVNLRLGPGGRGFAIPINDAMAIAAQIRARIPSDSVHIGPPTLLGVGVRTAPLRTRPGVVIQDVLRGGPAEAAGLRSGDVLIVVDGTPLNSAGALTDTLDRRYPGDVVDLVWIDADGQQRTGKATLAAQL